MPAPTFWKDRVKVHGHTGWAYPRIYAFDQAARLLAIQDTVDRFGLSGDAAMDYGCGTGDFSRLLSTAFKHVYAFDICDDVVKIAETRTLGRQITFASSLERLS